MEKAFRRKNIFLLFFKGYHLVRKLKLAKASFKKIIIENAF